MRLHGARALANRHYLGAGSKPFARLALGAQRDESDYLDGDGLGVHAGARDGESARAGWEHTFSFGVDDDWKPRGPPVIASDKSDGNAAWTSLEADGTKTSKEKVEDKSTAAQRAELRERVPLAKHREPRERAAVASVACSSVLKAHGRAREQVGQQAPALGRIGAPDVHVDVETAWAQNGWVERLAHARRAEHYDRRSSPARRAVHLREQK